MPRGHQSRTIPTKSRDRLFDHRRTTRRVIARDLDIDRACDYQAGNFAGRRKQFSPSFFRETRECKFLLSLESLIFWRTQTMGEMVASRSSDARNSYCSACSENQTTRSELWGHSKDPFRIGTRLAWSRLSAKCQPNRISTVCHSIASEIRIIISQNVRGTRMIGHDIISWTLSRPRYQTNTEFSCVHSAPASISVCFHNRQIIRHVVACTQQLN